MTGPGYCQHDRLEGNCETCAEQHARERGLPLAPPVPTAVDDRPIADRDLLIPDHGSDLDRHTVIASGTRVPLEHVDAYQQATKPTGKTTRR